MKHNNELTDLLDKYLASALTEKEAEYLSAHLREEDNQQVLEQYIDDYMHSLGDGMLENPLLLKEVQQHLKTNIAAGNINATGKVLSHRSFFQRSWWAAAAIFILIAAAGYWWTQQSAQPAKNTTRQAAIPDIAPGRTGAILTLADGSKVVLDSLSDGRITTQNGTEVLLGNGQLAYRADHTISDKATYNTLTTPRGRQYQLALPDGTRVWLNAESSITYPTSFNGPARDVEIKGEAYFEVVPVQDKASSKMPFRVKINTATTVDVLGTHFNINSYTDESAIKTTLLEGSVRMISGNNNVILKPGQQAAATLESIKVINDANIDQTVAWKNGLFNFKDADLPAVLRQLERWYDIKVKYEGKVPVFRFQGKLDRGLQLSDALVALSEVGVKFRVEERILIISE